MWKGLCVYRGDCPRTQIPIGGNLQIESERPDDMGKTSENLAELGGNQSGYAQEISNRKFETPSNGVIGRPEGGRPEDSEQSESSEFPPKKSKPLRGFPRALWAL